MTDGPDADEDDGSERSDAGTGADDRDPAGPLGDLAADVRRRGRRRDDADAEDPFEAVDVEDVDREELWRQISEGGAAATGGEDAAVVSKRDYCHRCEHFSEPPDIRCTHEGTRIEELVGVDRFRVIDCPVVRENARFSGED